LINTAAGRVKANNIKRDSRVAVSVVDPEDPYNVVVVKGTVTAVTEEGAGRAYRRARQEVPRRRRVPHAPAR